MAKAIATVTGVALAPGISRNRRYYTRPAIKRMVVRAQERLAAGETIEVVRRDDLVDAPPQPLAQLTHHAAEDDSTRIVGRLTSLSFDEATGHALYGAEIADTPHGQTIAALADTTDGRPPFLRGVSIRAAWVGGARMERGPDGDPVETGDDLELDGLDYTRKPGVPGAGITTFAWTGDGASRETTARVPITESVQEALVTITEATTPVAEQSCADQGHQCCRTAAESAAASPAAIREAERWHVLRDGLCVTCETTEAATPMSQRTSGTQGTGGPFADPGYQADKKQRYQLDTKAHAKAAWSYIGQAKNAKAYSANQLKRIKARIMKALKKFGVSTAAEGWVIDAARQVTESANDAALIREWYGDDPDTCGSWSINASNGPVSLNLYGYRMDPADLDAVLRAAADAACQALAALDPDMDGDIDVPGTAGDTDGDAGESAPADPADVAEDDAAGTDGTPAPEPAAGETAERTESAMPTETTTPTAAATEAAPALTQADVDAAVARALAVRAPAAESAPAAPVALTQADVDAAVARALAVREAAPAPAASVTESEADKVARLIREGLAARFPQETEDERIQRLVTEGLDAAAAQMIASGQMQAGRKGIVRPAGDTGAAGAVAESLGADGLPVSWGGKQLHEMSQDEFNLRTGPVVVRHVLGDRADKLS